MVGVPGVEPGTSSLSGTRSNQLSYTPAGIRPDDQPRIRPVELLLPTPSAGHHRTLQSRE